MFLRNGIYWSPDSGAGDSPGDGAGDTPGPAREGGAGTIPDLSGPLTLTAHCVVFKVGNRLPHFKGTIFDNGTALDLTSADAITFRMRPSWSPDWTISGATATLDPDVVGGVVYAWAANDLAAEGVYFVDVTPTWGGESATAPGGSYVVLTVLP